MLRILCYLLVSACIFLTTAALPIAVAHKKDSKFCCKCTVEEDESTDKLVPKLGSGFINTINVLTGSLTGCKGLTGGVDGGFINIGGGGFMNAYIGGSSASLMMPSVQIRVPQVQFPSPINIVPQQQYLMYNLPLQSPFFGIQQPKVSTQCCVPCPDGSGICCCTPGATTAAPRDSHTVQSPYYPAGAEIPLKSTSVLISTITVLILYHIL